MARFMVQRVSEKRIQETGACEKQLERMIAFVNVHYDFELSP